MMVGWLRRTSKSHNRFGFRANSARKTYSSRLGFCRPIQLLAEALLAVILCCSFFPSAQAAAQDTVDRPVEVNIPSGTLDDAIRVLALQSGVTIAGTIGEVSQVRTAAVRGRMSPRAALRRLLAGTPFSAQVTGKRSFRIVHRRAQPTYSAPSGTSRPPSATPSIRRSPRPAPPPTPIIVTASKQPHLYESYPGSTTVIPLDEALPGILSNGLENLLSTLPITSSTNLGSGRNKLFIRGVADSSFNGPTQSTIGLYFGDLRLIYSAPNPDLRLYDFERVELLEGPQGTLYGVGALGGVIRMAPKRAALDTWEAAAWAGGGAAQDGAVSYNLAGLLNAPLGDVLAVRALGYYDQQGGYIDDVGRAEDNVNRTRIQGWRTTARFEPAEGWAVDLDWLQQTLNTRDGQYAEPTVGPLQRRSLLDQPFDNDIMGLGLTLRTNLGGASLVSATGRFHSDLDTVFDASTLSNTGGPLVFDEEREIRLTSHETRVASDPNADIKWVIGGSFAHNLDRRRQFFGNPENDDLERRAEATNELTEYSLFGESTFPLVQEIYGTVGGRLVYTESFVEEILGDGEEVDPQINALKLLPTAALSWRPLDGVVAYVRYQEGYRAGGISIDGADEVSTVISRFTPDTLQSIEVGGRIKLGGSFPIEIATSAFYTDWNDIQADQIDAQGFPATRNVGYGEIVGLTASATVIPSDNLRISGAIFVNEVHFDPAPDVAADDDGRLPNVAAFGGRLSAQFSAPVTSEINLEVGLAIDYTSKSLLDTDPTLQFEQGAFGEAQASVALRTNDWTVSVEGSNLANSRGNSFAFGNPFTVRDVPQTTPVRPRAVRLSAKAKF